jgi:hypothetical protein
VDGFFGYLAGAAIGGFVAGVIGFWYWLKAKDEGFEWKDRCENAESARDRLRGQWERAERDLRQRKDARLELYALRERIEDAIEACGSSGEKQ